MENSLIILLSFVLLIVGILGTFLPVLPGLIVSLGGLLIYKFGTDADLPMVWIWIFVVLTIASAILNYVIPARNTKKYGGTKWGSWGSFIGTIVGLMLPIPLGFLVGMFAGAFVGELLHDRNDKQKAWNATKGAFFGFLYGTGFSMMVGLAMFLVVLMDIFNLI